METKEASKYITINEAANYLGASWNLVRTHVVPNVETVRIGRKIMILEESFKKYLKKASGSA